MDFRGTLGLIASAFAGREGDWALIGGLALGLHGVPRTTVDVDLLVRGEALGPLDAALLGAGYTLEHRWEESSHYTSDGTRLCPVDVLHAHRPHSLAMLRRARSVVVDEASGLALRVVEPEDLIGLKLQAMVNDPQRERQEVADIRALLEVAAGERPLDGERLRAYFGLFERADLLPLLLKGLERAVR